LLYCQELCKLENNFDSLEYLHILRGKNETADELSKLSSSRVVVPPGIFLQELHEPTIAKALTKTTKAAESSQETMQPTDSTTKSLEVMEIYFDWRTPFMIYLRTGAYWTTKLNANDCVGRQDNTL
jgi:hypothetical protein